MKAIVRNEKASIQDDISCAECMVRWQAVGCYVPCTRCNRWKVLKGGQDEQEKK